METGKVEYAPDYKSGNRYVAQRRWQQKQREQGRCINCAEPAVQSKRGGPGQYCETHQKRNREYMKNYQRRRKNAQIDFESQGGRLTPLIEFESSQQQIKK